MSERSAFSSAGWKICHLIHDGASTGGGATLARTYFPPYAGQFGFDVFVAVGSEGSLVEDLRRLGLRVFSFPMGRPWKALFSLPRLWSLFRRERPDAVIVHGQWGGIVGSIAARIAGVPRVLYYTHFPFFYTDWDLWRLVRNRLVEGTTCRLADRAVCLSEAGRYQYLLRKMAPEDRFFVIPNGVDPGRVAPTSDKATLRRELGLSEEGPLVVSVSRLSDQKRIDWLLRAWVQVEERFPGATLCVVGSGEEEAALRCLAGSLGLKRCHFAGARSEGWRYFAAADAGVICSLYECVPLALIEAMLAECPMVGTAVDGISEAIDRGRTGLLVPPADPAALAAAIEELLADPKRAGEMGKIARERALELYALDGVLARQVALLREVLGGEPDRSAS